jgi:hypothetical protein
VVSDVLVDDEAPVVTLRISRSAGAQSFGGAHRGRVCVRVFIGVSVRAVVSVCVVLCQYQKKDEQRIEKDAKFQNVVLIIIFGNVRAIFTMTMSCLSITIVVVRIVHEIDCMHLVSPQCVIVVCNTGEVLPSVDVQSKATNLSMHCHKLKKLVIWCINNAGNFKFEYEVTLNQQN